VHPSTSLSLVLLLEPFRRFSEQKSASRIAWPD
jgi:hypothetical protein